MMTVNAHFDGKVIIPDEPIELPPNQPLIVRIEAIGANALVGEQSAQAWLAANAVDSDTLPVELADQHDRYLYGGLPKDK